MTTLRPVPGALSRELALRGLSKAGVAGMRIRGLGHTVLSKVDHGQPVSDRTIARLAVLLAQHPPLDGVDRLLGLSNGGHGEHGA